MMTTTFDPMGNKVQCRAIPSVKKGEQPGDAVWVRLDAGQDSICFHSLTIADLAAVREAFDQAYRQAWLRQCEIDAANHAQDETDVTTTEIDPNNDGQIAPTDPPPLDDCRWVEFADLPEWCRNVISDSYRSFMAVADYRWVQLANGSWVSSYAQELNAKAKS